MTIDAPETSQQRRRSRPGPEGRRKSTIAAYTDLSDSDSENDEEFFDAVGAGEVRVEAMPSSSVAQLHEVSIATEKAKEKESSADRLDISASFKGYEDPVRERLKMAADDRPKISLWVSLASPESHIFYLGSDKPPRASSNP